MRYKARKTLQVGDVVYNEGDFVDPTDVLMIESWVHWGDVEAVEEPKPVKKAEPHHEKVK